MISTKLAKIIASVICLLFFIFIIIFCTKYRPGFPKQFAAAKDSVLQMTRNIAADVTHDGPIAWLRYFENSSEFFMASDGQLVFPDYAFAKNFINNTLVKSISKLELAWTDIRAEAFSADWANIAALFHETITDDAGKTIQMNGYFTAVARCTSQGWKLHNAHWSIEGGK